MAHTAQEIETQILLAISRCDNAVQLHNEVFGNDKLLDKYLQFSPSSENIQKLLDLVFQRIQVLRFDEFRNLEISDWKRVRASIEHENNLVNHRLSWLFSSQAFLFTAFTLTLNAWKSPAVTGNHFLYMLVIISTIGILICLSIQRGLNAGSEQIRALDRWWYRDKTQSSKYVTWKNRKERNTEISKLQQKHPPLQGSVSYTWWDQWFTPAVVPSFFLVAWATVIVLVVFELSFPITKSFVGKVLLVLSYVAVAGVALVIRHLISRSR